MSELPLDSLREDSNYKLPSLKGHKIIKDIFSGGSTGSLNHLEDSPAIVFFPDISRQKFAYVFDGSTKTFIGGMDLDAGLYLEDYSPQILRAIEPIKNVPKVYTNKPVKYGPAKLCSCETTHYLHFKVRVPNEPKDFSMFAKIILHNVPAPAKEELDCFSAAGEVSLTKKYWDIQMSPKALLIAESRGYMFWQSETISCWQPQNLYMVEQILKEKTRSIRNMATQETALLTMTRDKVKVAARNIAESLLSMEARSL